MGLNVDFDDDEIGFGFTSLHSPGLKNPTCNEANELRLGLARY